MCVCVREFKIFKSQRFQIHFGAAHDTRGVWRCWGKVHDDRQRLKKISKGSLGCASEACKDWPRYSPELDPEEHVWTRAEPDLRSLETDDDAFADWKKCSLLSERTFRLKTLLALWRRDANTLKRQGAMLDK